MGSSSTDVLIVGAGPTGLTLAAGLTAFGARFRIIDRQPDQVHESRALAIQPRTLEALAGLGIADPMIERGNPAVRLQLHARGRTTEMPLFDIGLEDTAYPFLLFLSQAETEAILVDHLATHDVHVERGIELVGLHQDTDSVTCSLRDHGGEPADVEARYVVGCDGANSSVRHHAGIDFTGSTYPQTFVLADLAAHGLDPGAVHAHLAGPGILFFFPLDQPAPWRLLGMRPDPAPPAQDTPTLGELQALTDTYTTEPVILDEPVWATNFRLQLRHARHYRIGRVLLAGDAAHVHSPAGAQGMNTGIQDAWNLAWKLAWVTNGTAKSSLLDTYETERQPIGRAVLRLTNRAFSIATSTNPLIRCARTRLAPRLLRLALAAPTARARAFRTLSQLAINYRTSALSHDDTRRHPGPRAGDRLPDAPVAVDDQPTTLHRALGPPDLHLITTDPHASPLPVSPQLHIHHLTPEPTSGGLVDTTGQAHHRLGLLPHQPVHILIRPDGHIAYRTTTPNRTHLDNYLDHWLDAPRAG